MRDILVQRTQKVPQLKSNFWDFPTEWAERFRYGVDCGLTGVQLRGEGGGCLVCLSICPFVCLSLLLDLHFNFWVNVCLSICLFVALDVCRRLYSFGLPPFPLLPCHAPLQLAQLDVCSICLYIFNFGADRRPTHFPRPLSFALYLCITLCTNTHTHIDKCNLVCECECACVRPFLCIFALTVCPSQCLPIAPFLRLSVCPSVWLMPKIPFLLPACFSLFSPPSWHCLGPTFCCCRFCFLY